MKACPRDCDFEPSVVENGMYLCTRLPGAWKTECVLQCQQGLNHRGLSYVVDDTDMSVLTCNSDDKWLAVAKLRGVRHQVDHHLLQQILVRLHVPRRLDRREALHGRALDSGVSRNAFKKSQFLLLCFLFCVSFFSSPCLSPDGLERFSLASPRHRFGGFFCVRIKDGHCPTARGCATTSEQSVVSIGDFLAVCTLYAYRT